MKLNLQQLQLIATGAAYVEQTAEGVEFHRFTRQQEALYEVRSAEFFRKCFAPSGVQLRFRTDSKHLGLKTEVFRSSTRRYYAVEVRINGERLDTIDNFRNVEVPQNYTTKEFALEPQEKVFDLGDGEKDVQILLPWSVRTVLKEMTLDDGASLIPVKAKHKMLCYGDSITHGYDAMYPSNKYITKLAAFLDAEEHNKAIGGEVFFPELAASGENFVPDYISVAYGTNDWSKCEFDVVIDNCTRFFEALHNAYPTSRIFAITPIWRKDGAQPKRGVEFAKVEELILSATAKYDNITVISGYDLVGHDPNLFADLRLHPNDEGFGQYAVNLTAKVAALI